MTATAATTALLLVWVAGQQGGPSTTVGAPRPVDIDDARGSLGGDALSLYAPEDALFALGAGAIHDGGPWSPSRITLRGLAGPRLAVSFDGVPLGDPAGAHFDAALLPWGFADVVTVESGSAGSSSGALGGAVRLTSASVDAASVRARLLVGELSTVRLLGRASTPLPGGALAVGLDGATTRGDFSFVPAGAAPGSAAGAAMRRDNNDQRRATGLASAKTQLGELAVDATLLAAGHEGGIPGFALAPTQRLRGEDGVVAARAGARVPVGGASLGASLGARAAHRATEGPADPRSAVQSAATDLSVAVTRVPLGDGADADLAARGGEARAYASSGAHQRVFAGAGVGARAAIGPLRLRVRGAGDALTDARPLFSGELRVEAGDALRGSLSVARAERAPTLEELYAPTGLVLGNPDLRPERTHDIEGAIAFLPGRVVAVRAVAFAGLIDDAIAYTNRNAYQIAPDNTGAAARLGLDTFIFVEPSRWCALAATVGLLSSRVDATGAPLPLAPPWSSRVAVRAGYASALTVEGVLRARGPVSSNSFGTLVAPAISLVDVVARAPLAPGLWLSGALHNALDVRDARDQNQLPLPGRLWLVGLEVAP